MLTLNNGLPSPDQDLAVDPRSSLYHRKLGSEQRTERFSQVDKHVTPVLCHHEHHKNGNTVNYRPGDRSKQQENNEAHSV